MIHLLPLRFIGKFIVVATVCGVVAVLFVQTPAEGSLLEYASTIVRWALAIEAFIAIAFAFGWHYVPGVTTRWLFPYVDGSWDGTILFERKDTPDGEAVSVFKGQKEATLHVHQSLFQIRIVLETNESTSETLVVRAERDPDFSRFRLFYIFENKTRDGIPNDARIYKGTAFMEVSPGQPTILNGTYFTDRGSEGTFRFNRRKMERAGLCGKLRSITEAKGAASPLASTNGSGSPIGLCVGPDEMRLKE